MNLVLQTPKECEKLENLRAEIQQVCEQALAQRITSLETKDATLEIGSQVKRMRKALDDRRKEITNPLQETVKQVIAFAKKLDEPLERAENHVRAQAISYAEAIAEEQRREQARIAADKARVEAEHQAKMRAAATMSESFEEQIQFQERFEQDKKIQKNVLATQERTLKEQAVKGTREEWTYEITDALLVPDHFWVIDESLIRNAVKVQKVREIPGIRIFTKTTVSLGRY